MDASSLRTALRTQPLTRGYFKDVVPADLVPSKPFQQGIYIVNTHEQHAPGEHWVTIEYDRGTTIYFDPMGFPPHPTILFHLRKTGINGAIVFNPKRYQGIRSTCGLYCLYQILTRISSAHSLNVFADDLEFNDRMVYILTKHYFPL